MNADLFFYLVPAAGLLALVYAFVRLRWIARQPAGNETMVRIAGHIADGAVAFHDLDGSGPIYGDGFIGNRDRYYGIARNSDRLPDFFELSASAAFLIPVGDQRVELRADVFNVFNATQWGGFATGLPGGGSRTQIGRPGDPLELGQPGRPREVQLSARYVF